MDNSIYQALVKQFIDNNKDVIEGKMMSSPGLKVKDKVFAFFHENEMGFRLGKDFDPSAEGLHHWHLLSPFKTKPPLKAWFIVEEADSEHWTSLCQRALDFTRQLK